MQVPLGNDHLPMGYSMHRFLLRNSRRARPGRALDRIRACRRSRGQALVELALLVPVLAVLFLATLDLGRVFYSQITITNAAREAAFKAAEDPTSFTSGTCDAVTSRVVCAAVNESRNSFVTVTPSDVTLTCLPNPACPKTYGQEATVTVTGHFNLFTPLMAAFTGGSNITLTSSASANVVIVPVIAAATPSPSPTPTPAPTPAGTPTPTPPPDPTPTPVCPPPYAAFTYTQQNKNKPVVFTSTSTPTSGSCAINYWRWDFGDNVLSTGNPTTTSHTYAVKGGTYVVKLTVTGPGGDPSQTTDVYVTITTLP